MRFALTVLIAISLSGCGSRTLPARLTEDAHLRFGGFGQTRQDIGTAFIVRTSMHWDDYDGVPIEVGDCVFTAPTSTFVVCEFPPGRHDVRIGLRLYSVEIEAGRWNCIELTDSAPYVHVVECKSLEPRMKWWEQVWTSQNSPSEKARREPFKPNASKERRLPRNR